MCDKKSAVSDLGKCAIVFLAAVLVLDELLNLGIMVWSFWRPRDLELLRGRILLLVLTKDFPDCWDILGHYTGRSALRQGILHSE